ncbi:unnamed protein product, partial [Mesorhabditis belari]|uniref:E3 ubiquitin-protein ligase RNF170 n=1 Tax=Mesorhabditis belari TaxID=2138241 RepID=A0AAF3F508_9BILA
MTLDMETITNYSDEYRLIEGVDNNVTMACFLLVAFTCAIYYAYKKGKELRQSIHPQLVANVDAFRAAEARLDNASAERLREARANNDQIDCPICYTDAKFAVLTNCGHIFCCECIIGYWQHSASPVAPVACAICRTPVTMLLPVNWRFETTDEDDQDALQENNIRLDDYNRRFSGERPWIDYLYDLPVLIPYALQNLADFNGLGTLFRIRIIVCLATAMIYLLAPFDVFPESVYGILGFVDDIFVIFIVLIYFAGIIRDFMAQRGQVQRDPF